MAIAYRSSSAVATGTTMLAISMPPGTVENDIMIMAVSCHQSGYTYSISSGWTVIGRAQGTNGWGLLAWKRASASEAGPYYVAGLVDSCCGAISSFSGCRAYGSPVDEYALRANASGVVGTAGITTTVNGEMIINSCAVMDNLSLSTWATVNLGTMQERFDGRTTNGSDTGIGLSTVSQTTAGATGNTSYSIVSAFENVGMACSLLPLDMVSLTVADGVHGHVGDVLGAVDIGLVLLDDSSHANVVDNIQPMDTQLAIDDASHAHAVDNTTITHNVVATLITYLWTFLISSPAVGGVPGPKIPANCDVKEVSSYVTAATSVVFNIEERTAVGSAGTNILSSDQTASTTGASATSFSNGFLAKDNYLWVDISAVNGTPGVVEITLACTNSPDLVLENGLHGHDAVSVVLTQVHTLAVDNSEHSTVSDEISSNAGILVDDSEHSHTVGNLDITQDFISTVGGVPGFWAWIIDLPAIGGIPGLKIPRSCRVTSIQSYTTAETSVTFNIEERATLGSAGTDIMAAEQVAVVTGALTTEFTEIVLEKDHWLWIDISAVSGTPGYLMVTLEYRDSILQSMDNGYHAVESDNISLDVGMVVDDCSHTNVSGEPAISEDTGEMVGLVVDGFYTWSISSPTIGVVPGPKIPVDIVIQEISSYVTSATSASFNVEFRGSPNTVGTDVLSADQVSDITGESSTSFVVGTVGKDRYLVLDISAVSGTPGVLSVTVYWKSSEQGVSNCSHAHTVDNIDLTETTSGLLVVQDSSHSTASDNVDATERLRRTVAVGLTVSPVVLVVADCSHSNVSESPVVSGATRIFLPSSGTPVVSPSFGSAWGETPDADRIKATMVKGSTALTTKHCYTQNFEETRVLNRQYVLGEGVGLSAYNFTTADVFNITMRCLESSSSANCYLYLTIDVYDITGAYLIGNIFDGTISTTEFSYSALTSRYCSSKNITGAVNMPSGSLLVFGVGIDATNMDGVEYALTMSFGDAPATALDLSDADTGADYPYIEFPSILLSEYSPELVVDNCSHSNVVENIGLNMTLVVEDSIHDLDSEVPSLSGVASTLAVADGSHAHVADVVDLPVPPGRRLWVKVRNHWVKVAPTGT